MTAQHRYTLAQRPHSVPRLRPEEEQGECYPTNETGLWPNAPTLTQTRAILRSQSFTRGIHKGLRDDNTFTAETEHLLRRPAVKLDVVAHTFNTSVS